MGPSRLPPSMLPLVVLDGTASAILALDGLSQCCSTLSDSAAPISAHYRPPGDPCDTHPQNGLLWMTGHPGWALRDAAGRVCESGRERSCLLQMITPSTEPHNASPSWRPMIKRDDQPQWSWQDRKMRAGRDAETVLRRVRCYEPLSRAVRGAGARLRCQLVLSQTCSQPPPQSLARFSSSPLPLLVC